MQAHADLHRAMMDGKCSSFSADGLQHRCLLLQLSRHRHCCSSKPGNDPQQICLKTQCWHSCFALPSLRNGFHVGPRSKPRSYACTTSNAMPSSVCTTPCCKQRFEGMQHKPVRQSAQAQPVHRAQRAHTSLLTIVDHDPEALCQSLCKGGEATKP